MDSVTMGTDGVTLKFFEHHRRHLDLVVETATVGLGGVSQCDLALGMDCVMFLDLPSTTLLALISIITVLYTACPVPDSGSTPGPPTRANTSASKMGFVA